MEKRYNLEVELEITENELIELNNRNEVASRGEKEEISKIQELKKKKKDLKNKVNKLKKKKKAIGKNDLGGLVIDRKITNKRLVKLKHWQKRISSDGGEEKRRKRIIE